MVFFFIFRPVVRTTAIAAIKGQATQLSISQIRERLTVEKELFKAVKTRLEGKNEIKYQYQQGRSSKLRGNGSHLDHLVY